MRMQMRKYIILLIAAMIILVFMPILGAPVSAASKPAKVKGLKASVSGQIITLKWSKAKRAKKYQVFRKVGSKYKKVKTTKSRSYKFTGSYSTSYRIKVRAVRGKRTGKFSTVKTVKIPVKKPGIHKDRYYTIDDADQLLIGDYYLMKGPVGDPILIRIQVGESDSYDDEITEPADGDSTGDDSTGGDSIGSEQTGGDSTGGDSAGTITRTVTIQEKLIIGTTPSGGEFVWHMDGDEVTYICDDLVYETGAAEDGEAA